MKNSENKMKELLGNAFTDNSIVNYLNYLMLGKNICPTPENLFNKRYKELTNEQKVEYNINYGEWRKKFDLDVIWLEGDLNADTIFSVWKPLKMCLQYSKSYPYKFQGDKCYPYKQDGFISKSGNLINFLTDIKQNLDIYLPPNKWKKLYEFVELATTRANVMRLPDRRMQERAKIEWINGKKKTIESFYEQMPRTLFECFEGGEFRNSSKNRDYFMNDENLKSWIKDEHLEAFFINRDISRDSIKPLIQRMKPSKSEWLTKERELLEMIENYKDILELRQTDLK